MSETADTATIGNSTLLSSVSGSGNFVTDLDERIYNITRARRREDHTEVTIQTSASSPSKKLFLSRFTYLWQTPSGGALDRLAVRENTLNEVIGIDKILKAEYNNFETARIFPYFCTFPNLEDSKILSEDHDEKNLTIREITTIEDLRSVKQLSSFHYLSNECSWGRKAFLVAYFRERNDYPWIPIGYILLASPGLFSGPRGRLLGWQRADEQIKNANRVVRIARVVVHPEFRGLGIGVELVKSALFYARDYWNVQGMKPWLVEAVAEMSRYHPFFEKAGMHLFGETGEDKEVIFTDLSKLESGQGKGYYKSSILRIKGNVHTPKPYYWYALNRDINHEIARRLAIDMTNLPKPVPTIGGRNLGKLCMAPLRVESVTLRKYPLTNWDEPKALLEEYLLHKRQTEMISNDTVRSIGTMKWTLHHLVDSSKLQELLADIRDPRVKANCRKKLAIIKRKINAQERKSKSRHTNVKLTYEIEMIKERIIEDLKAWDILRLDISGSVKELVRELECSLSREKKYSRNICTNKARLALIRLSKDLESGPSSERFEAVRAAFGVQEHTFPSVLEDVNFDIHPGNIALISGPSGSGKTSLFRIITGDIIPTSGRVSGYNPTTDVGALNLDFDPTKRLIDLVGTDTRSAISILNYVGLTEASLYLKRRDELSNGQRYRAAAALLVDSRKMIWVADEFCTALDRTTTHAVIKGIRKIANDTGATLIVASANPDQVITWLQPDVHVRLQFGKVVMPRYVICSWNGHKSLDSLLSSMMLISDTQTEGISASNIHVLRAIGLVVKTIDISKPPHYTLSQAGKMIMHSRYQKRDLALYLYWNDLILHRLSNTLAINKESATVLDIAKSSKFDLLPGVKWKRSTLKREMFARKDIAQYILEKKLTIAHIPFKSR